VFAVFDQQQGGKVSTSPSVMSVRCPARAVAKVEPHCVQSFA
jgi:hypothetical protein